MSSGPKRDRKSNRNGICRIFARSVKDLCKNAQDSVHNQYNNSLSASKAKDLPEYSTSSNSCTKADNPQNTSDEHIITDRRLSAGQNEGSKVLRRLSFDQVIESDVRQSLQNSRTRRRFSDQDIKAGHVDSGKFTEQKEDFQNFASDQNKNATQKDGSVEEDCVNKTFLEKETDKSKYNNLTAQSISENVGLSNNEETSDWEESITNLELEENVCHSSSEHHERKSLKCDDDTGGDNNCIAAVADSNDSLDKVESALVDHGVTVVADHTCHVEDDNSITDSLSCSVKCMAEPLNIASPEVITNKQNYETENQASEQKRLSSCSSNDNYWDADSYVIGDVVSVKCSDEENQVMLADSNSIHKEDDHESKEVHTEVHVLTNKTDVPERKDSTLNEDNTLSDVVVPMNTVSKENQTSDCDSAVREQLIHREVSEYVANNSSIGQTSEHVSPAVNDVCSNKEEVISNKKFEKERGHRSRKKSYSQSSGDKLTGNQHGNVSGSYSEHSDYRHLIKAKVKAINKEIKSKAVGYAVLQAVSRNVPKENSTNQKASLELPDESPYKKYVIARNMKAPRVDEKAFASHTTVEKEHLKPLMASKIDTPRKFKNKHKHHLNDVINVGYSQTNTAVECIEETGKIEDVVTSQKDSNGWHSNDESVGRSTASDHQEHHTRKMHYNKEYSNHSFHTSQEKYNYSYHRNNHHFPYNNRFHKSTVFSHQQSDERKFSYSDKKLFNDWRRPDLQRSHDKFIHDINEDWESSLFDLKDIEIVNSRKDSEQVVPSCEESDSETSTKVRSNITEELRWTTPPQGNGTDEFKQTTPLKENNIEEFRQTMPLQENSTEELRQTTCRQDNSTEELKQTTPLQENGTEELKHTTPLQENGTEEWQSCVIDISDFVYSAKQNKDLSCNEDDPPTTISDVNDHTKDVKSEKNNQSVSRLYMPPPPPPEELNHQKLEFQDDQDGSEMVFNVCPSGELIEDTLVREHVSSESEESCLPCSDNTASRVPTISDYDDSLSEGMVDCGTHVVHSQEDSVKNPMKRQGETGVQEKNQGTVSGDKNRNIDNVGPAVHNDVVDPAIHDNVMGPPSHDNVMGPANHNEGFKCMCPPEYVQFWVWRSCGCSDYPMLCDIKCGANLGMAYMHPGMSEDFRDGGGRFCRPRGILGMNFGQPMYPRASPNKATPTESCDTETPPGVNYSMYPANMEGYRPVLPCPVYPPHIMFPPPGCYARFRSPFTFHSPPDNQDVRKVIKKKSSEGGKSPCNKQLSSENVLSACDEQKTESSHQNIASPSLPTMIPEPLRGSTSNGIRFPTISPTKQTSCKVKKKNHSGQRQMKDLQLDSPRLVDYNLSETEDSEDDKKENYKGRQLFVHSDTSQEDSESSSGDKRKFELEEGEVVDDDDIVNKKRLVESLLHDNKMPVYVPPHKRLSWHLNQEKEMGTPLQDVSKRIVVSKKGHKRWSTGSDKKDHSESEVRSAMSKEDSTKVSPFWSSSGHSPGMSPLYGLSPPVCTYPAAYFNEKRNLSASNYAEEHQAATKKRLDSDSKSRWQSPDHWQKQDYKSSESLVPPRLRFLQKSRLLDTDSDSSSHFDWKTRFKEKCRTYPGTFIDSHCHIDFLFNRQGFRGSWSKYKLINADTFPDNYEGCVAVFCYPGSFRSEGLWKDVALEDGVWLAFGCHPKHATEFTQKTEEGLRRCLQNEKVVALGEIGLDYSGIFIQHEVIQKAVFVKQIQIALEMKKPLVIHCRDAENDCLEILERMVPRHYKIHCHCFTGNFVSAKKWMDLFPNLYIGLTPLVSYRTAEPTHEVARFIPLERLLLETDAPYFIPRKIPKDDMPYSHCGMAVTVAEDVARLKRCSVGEVLLACRQNTRNMYGI